MNIYPTKTTAHILPAKHTLGEEIASAITHGIGAALSVAALTSLIIFAALSGDPWSVVAVSIYGSTLVFLYLASTLYHGIQIERVKRFFHIMDHVGISLLIAGTYTPILLVQMRTTMGWVSFGVIWGLALTAASIKSFFTNKYKRVSTTIYVAMGWFSIFLINSMIATMGVGGVAWIAAGGICYTLGVIPFLWEKLPYNHAIWHLFVIGGSTCHFIAILLYVLPAA